MNYYISDLHFGHFNVIVMNHRPFETVEEMNETIIKNWNETVKDDDHVYILGDVFYRFDGNMEKVLKELKGQKHLIIGNHDGRLLKNKKALQLFESVDYYKEINETLNGQPTQVIMCHYPIVKWNGFFRSSIHLYGHIHNSTNETYEIMKKVPKAYNVGADILDFCPRTLESVISYNEKFKKKY